MKYEVDINELSKSELYDLLVIRDNKITELLNTIKEIKKYILERAWIDGIEDKYLYKSNIEIEIGKILKLIDKENKDE